MAIVLNSSNPYARSVSTAVSSAGTGASISSKSMSTGTRHDLNPVESYLSSSLKDEARVLGAVNKSVSYAKSQLSTMKHSLEKMKNTVSDMIETVVTTGGKTREHRVNLKADLLTSYHLFNKQLDEAKFDGKDLLKGADFTLNLRMGVAATDVFAIKVDKIALMDVIVRGPGAGYVGELDVATDPESTLTETALNVYLKDIKSRIVAVESYMKSVDQISEGIEAKVTVTEETAAGFSNTDLVKEAQKFQDNVSKMATTLAVLGSGNTIANKVVDQVAQTLRG